jgi:hypothetical protein
MRWPQVSLRLPTIRLGVPDQIPTGTVNHEIRGIANGYNESVGLPPVRPFTPVEHDEPLAREISDWYEKTGSNPEDPEVQKSYDAFNARPTLSTTS